MSRGGHSTPPDQPTLSSLHVRVSASQALRGAPLSVIPKPRADRVRELASTKASVSVSRVPLSREGNASYNERSKSNLGPFFPPIVQSRLTSMPVSLPSDGEAPCLGSSTARRSPEAERRRTNLDLFRPPTDFNGTSPTMPTSPIPSTTASRSPEADRRRSTFEFSDFAERLAALRRKRVSTSRVARLEMPSPSAEFIDAALDNTAEPPEDAGRAETGSGPIVEESGELHGSNVPSSETLIDDESVSSDSLRFVTPGSIRDKLIALGGQPIQNIGELGKQVQQCSLFSPPGRDGGSSTFSLFLAGHTGVDRPYQDYVCRQDKCPAFVKYQLRDGLAFFIKGEFTHDHDVDTTTCRHPPAFSRDERRLVQDLTALGLSSGQIMLRTGLMPGPQPMYNARRGILEEMRSGQPDKLRDAMKKWPELETQLFHDKEKKFVGAYCFHKVFADSHVCRGTLIMDDTACTNMFGLPLILIVGNDEYNFTQIIAFAFTLNRTAISFEHFLGWVKEQLPVAPKAFVVDRHLGQLAALKTVFPESRIVFCRFHLAANIAATFHSDESQVLQAFYDLVKGRITEEVFIDRLKGEQTRYQETSAQWKLIDFLLGNLDHYSPIRISEYTRHQVSSRVEGVFAVLKRMLRGELCTLAGILVALHMYATSWFRRRLRPRLPSLPPWVMSRENQSCLGIYALSRIARQFPLVKSGFICDICEEAILNHQCCHKALMSKLPCVHFLAYRAGTRFEHGLPGDTVEDVGLPCLALGDIPAEYRQIELTGNVPVAHTTTELESAPGGHAHLSWEFGHLSARFEPVFEAARRDTAVQAMIERLLDEFDRHRATGATPGSEIQDPWRPRSRGRPPSRPSLRSLPGRLHRCKRARRS